MLTGIFGQVNPWILLWLIIAIVFIVVEMSTVTLTSIWFAAGAVGALLVAMCGGGIALQIIVFVVIATILLFATRPWAKKFVNGKHVSTNADRVIGAEVRVMERVSNLDQTGMAVVHGQEWTVRTEDDKTIIEQGELVRVIRISGVKLIVEKVEEN